MMNDGDNSAKNHQQAANGKELKVTYTCLYSVRKQMIACGVGLLAFACASAQVPQTEAPPAPAMRPLPRAVSLVSNSCPEIHNGDRIALDWNPGFDHLGPVTGLKTFSVTLAPLMENGVIGRSRITFSAGGKGHPVGAPLGNGYYHIEIPMSTMIAEGAYRVIDADAVAEVMPQYERDPPPQMTVSPAQERFCINVVANSRSQSSSLATP